MHESWSGKHREEIRLKLGKVRPDQVELPNITPEEEELLPLLAETACGSESTVRMCVQPNPVNLKLAKSTAVKSILCLTEPHHLKWGPVENTLSMFTFSQ